MLNPWFYVITRAEWDFLYSRSLNLSIYLIFFSILFFEDLYCIKVTFDNRVSSEKEKFRFAKIFIFATISLHFRISFAREKCENFCRKTSIRTVSRKIMRKFRKKNNAKILRKKYSENFAKK